MTIRRTCAALLTVTAVACGGGSDSPTAPTPPAPTTTRIIGVSGNLAFGDVDVGTSRDATITITNSGNAPLTVSSLTAGSLTSLFTSTFTSGTIAAGSSQSATLRFTPTSLGNVSGTLLVIGDQTSGSNAIAFSGNGVSSVTGTYNGGHTVTQCNGTGSAQDLICGAARGAYKVGTNFVFSANLTQNGNIVTGTANLAGTTGPVSGGIFTGGGFNGVLMLSGTLRDTQGFTAVITSWNTTVSGNAMTGTVAYTLTFDNLPGNAGIVATLNNVTR